MKVLLLGATGSIGTSTCNCVRRFRDSFQFVGISTNVNIELLAEQVKEFDVPAVCVADKQAYEKAKTLLSDSVKIYNDLQQFVLDLEFDTLVNAVVGAAGFRSTCSALERGKRVALANKESLVVGGDYINELLKAGKGELVPVDSEHSAILQCLNGESFDTIEKITVTASGGPFRTTPYEEFKYITVEKALKHPTWQMGAKITIDSSTLMNKGFEVIEAHQVFNVPYDKLDVLVHPQSIIHSMVTFTDGAVMAQCGVPDMELPIQYGLTYPKRMPIESERLDLAKIGTLTFEEPDYTRFPCLRLCLEAGREGGTMPAVLNAANEIAVAQFLQKNIRYDQIAYLIEKALNNHQKEKASSIELIMEIDQKTREYTLEMVQSL